VKQGGAAAEVIRFGAFEAVSRTGELRKNGLRIKLQEQPFQVLCLLLARPGELVTREELRAKLWPADTFVDFEHGLNKAINKLREALGDDREKPRYIETLPRRGYRFIAPVASDEPLLEPDQSQAALKVQPEPLAAGLPQRAPRLAPAVILMGAIILLASVVGYRLARRPAYPAVALSPSPIRSLAVLPLQNLSEDKDQEYFADGMTDELITDLGQLSGLRVISRTSVMHYKGTSETLPQIGRELGADAILEGSVFRAAGRVRITAQLIDAQTDKHLWAHEYERDLRDVISMQGEVARDIADEIRVKLTPQERVRLSTAHPVNPEAHEAYLKGRYYWNQFTQASVKKSLAFFQQAIKDDPNYALGYSGLADYYGVMYVRMGGLSRNEACPKAETAALKAVQMGDSLAEAHHSLAAIRLFCDWDSQGAESEFKRAIQLNPSYSEAHRVYGFLLVCSGRGGEVVSEIKRAVENDPMSVDITRALAWAYYATRHYDQAAKQYGKVLEMDPKRAVALAGLGEVYTQEGQYDAAIREYRKAGEFSGEAPWELSNLGYTDALAGRRREALEILGRLNQISNLRQVEAVDRAIVYIGLGDRQQAFAWLNKACEQREPEMLQLKVDPQYDSLRSDPRFQDLVRRVCF
jgi:TolB-like protein/DNA-binding winged helix-turn-helix (wHTH) protein/Flp pilus assembly protein TadD